MTKKHYITLAVCSLLIVISLACYGSYYRDYILPESYVVGSIQEYDYKELPIKEYLSDDMILFSQNINDVSFVNDSGIATYEYSFDHKDFNGEENSYSLFINNALVTSFEQTAGTFTGTYSIKYFDVNKNLLCFSNIQVAFSFYSMQSKLRVTLDSDDLGYLVYYFKTDNFIITLSKNSFVMNNKDVVVESSPKDDLQEIPITINSAKEISIIYSGVERTYTVDGSSYFATKVADYIVKAKDSISISFQRVNFDLLINTDGVYACEYNSETGYYDISWEDASYITITVEKSSSSGSVTV